MQQASSPYQLPHPKEASLISAASSGSTQEVLRLLEDPSLDPNCVDTNDFTPFNCAAWYGHVETITEMLKDDRVDPNKPGKIGEPPLFCAVQRREVGVIRVLVRNPRVDVNLRKADGATSLLFAAQEGYAEELRILLELPHIDVNIGLRDGATPLFLACQNGHLPVVKLLLGMGKQIDSGKTWNNSTPAQHAKAKGHPVISELLDRFHADRKKTTWELQVELGLPVALSSNLFALIIFISDNYLTMKGAVQSEEERQFLRFFEIATALPIDLQMVLTNRVYGLGQSIVKWADRERAFRQGARNWLD